MLIARAERLVSDRPKNAARLGTYAGMMNDSTLNVKLCKHEEKLSKYQEFLDSTMKQETAKGIVMKGKRRQWWRADVD